MNLECCVCIEEIDDVADNTITCGKVNHTLCRDCKMKCEDCPMCRSHKIKPPISQAVNLPIVKMNEMEKKEPKIIYIFRLEKNSKTSPSVMTVEYLW